MANLSRASLCGYVPQLDGEPHARCVAQVGYKRIRVRLKSLSRFIGRWRRRVTDGAQDELPKNVAVNSEM